MEVAPGLFHAGRVDRAPPAGEGQDQGVVAKLVDQAWHAVGRPVDRLAGLGGENVLGSAARVTQLGVNVLLCLRAIERLQVAAGHDPLAERIQFRRGQALFQRPVADQDQPHPRLPLGGHVGERADLV